MYFYAPRDVLHTLSMYLHSMYIYASSWLIYSTCVLLPVSKASHLHLRLVT
jgi:hypothetical protein